LQASKKGARNARLSWLAALKYGQTGLYYDEIQTFFIVAGTFFSAAQYQKKPPQRQAR